MTRIALHVLVLGSPRVPAGVLQQVVLQRFPNSHVLCLENARQATKQLRETVFDLVVMAVDPLRSAHAELLRALRNHVTAMPSVLILNHEEEGRLYEMVPDLPMTWELLHSNAFSDAVLERRLLKAIENHQRHWELNHLHQAFQSSLVQYRSLFDEVPDLIFLCDRSGCLLDVNATAVRMFGIEKEQLLMKPVFETFGMRQDDFSKLLATALNPQGPVRDFELVFTPGNRPPIYGLTHLIRWQSDSGRPAQFQGVIKDISPHKRLEQQLRESQDRYKTLYELARISSSSLRLDEVVTRSLELISHCTRAGGALLLMNRSYEELDPIAAFDVPEDVLQSLRQDPPMLGQDFIGRMAISEAIQKLELPLLERLHPAVEQWLGGSGATRLLVIALGRGNPTLPTTLLLLSIAARDEEMPDDELLLGLCKTLEMGMTNCFHYANSQETETRYRELWEHSPAYFISLLKGGIMFEVNQTAAQALGYPLHELIGHPFSRIIAPADQELFQLHHQQIMERGTPQQYELRLRTRTGGQLVVAVQSEPLLDRNGMMIGEKTVLHDITRGKELEARLRDYADNLEKKVEERTLALTQTMNFLNGILEGSTEYAIVGLDQHGTFLHFNRGAQLLFGYQAGSVVGQDRFSLLLNFEHAPWGTLEELLEQVDRQGVLTHEVPVETAGHRTMTMLLTINRLSMPAFNNLTYVAIMRDITEQKELEDLLKLYTENLQQVIEQKSRELDRQHIQLIQSSKLATLGEMAAGIAHELNQPLSGIRTRAQLVQKALERGMVIPQRIGQNQAEIIQLVDRITRIIHHMRIFARQDQQRFTPFHLSQSIDGALSLLGEQLRIHAIRVDRTEAPDLPLVLGEPLQIEQVILNLISNARDAIDMRAEQERKVATGGGTGGYNKCISIKLSQSTATELCLEVHDNGAGMSEETAQKIFEPFFTTKPVGRGTGLGLSISYGILSNHNGRCEVESQIGQGSSFRIFLPVWAGDKDVAAAVASEEVPG